MPLSGIPGSHFRSSWPGCSLLQLGSLLRAQVHEAKDDVMRLITGELSKPGFSDHELSFFKGELRRLSGSKAEQLRADSS